VIAKSFGEKNDKDLVRDQYLEWERDALESLASTTFGSVYLAPFGSARGTGIWSCDASVVMAGLVPAIHVRLSGADEARLIAAMATIEGLLDGVGSEDSPMSLMNHNIKGNSWYSLLEGKIGVLNGFLLELRKQ
jgi:hypothetical protein